MPKLLESILEIAKDTISKPADCGFREYCSKYAGAISVQHDCSFRSRDSYLDCILDRISIVIVRVSDVRFLRPHYLHRNHGERAFIS